MPRLGVPFGTYGHSPQYVLSKDGAVYTTSVGDMAKKQPWRGRVWRLVEGQPAENVYTAPGAHLALHVMNGELICAWVDLAGKVGFDKVAGYIPPDAEVTGTVVNIDRAQVAQLTQQLAQAIEAASRAQRAAEAATTRADKLAERIAALEKRAPTAAPAINEQKIADIVWSKIWDVLYLIRIGMGESLRGIPSKDPNIQGWINDLNQYIDSRKRP